MPTIHIRVSDADKRRLERLAQAAGQTLSDYIRSIGTTPKQAPELVDVGALAAEVETLRSAVTAQDRRLDELERIASGSSY